MVKVVELRSTAQIFKRSGWLSWRKKMETEQEDTEEENAKEEEKDDEEDGRIEREGEGRKYYGIGWERRDRRRRDDEEDGRIEREGEGRTYYGVR